MEKRPAFELRTPLIIYNIFQIILSGWMTYESCRLAWFNGYSLVCQPVDYSNSKESLQLLMIGYCFYISKIVDFLDTVFFILRKKDNQITFLHLYHHTPSGHRCVFFIYRIYLFPDICFYYFVTSFVISKGYHANIYIGYITLHIYCSIYNVYMC